MTPGGQVAGIDPSPPAIAYATRQAPANATFTVGAAQDLMFRVIRPDGTLLIADFRPSRWHRGPHGLRHAQAIDLAPLAEAAGFRVEAAGDLPMLRYIRAVR